jgi:hypothetical protein
MQSGWRRHGSRRALADPASVDMPGLTHPGWVATHAKWGEAGARNLQGTLGDQRLEHDPVRCVEQVARLVVGAMHGAQMVVAGGPDADRLQPR